MIRKEIHLALPVDPPPTEEEILKKWEDSWKEEEKKIDFPHSRKEYTFSRNELRQLLQQGTIEIMANKILDFSRSATNDIINLNVLTRVGIAPDPSMKILYDYESGKFMVWQPKEKPTETSEAIPVVQP